MRTPGERAAARWDARGTERLLRSARVFANSRWTRACVAARAPSARRARVVYYGKPALARAAAPAGLPRRFILTAARHAEYKGLDVLLMALRRLEDDGLAVPLVLCGQDDSGGGLARFAARLRLRPLDLGLLPPSRVPPLMGRADFLVLPSRRESLGGVVLEALAAGTPVVASRVGGIPELVRHGKEALLVPAKDPAALARAIARLWNDAPLRERMASAAKERAAAFTWREACAALAGTRRDGTLGALVWGDSRDQTARAFAANARQAFASLGQRCVSSFRDEAPPAADRYVVFLLRYDGFGRLNRFLESRGAAPTVYLC
ncbi:MAG: glycosyltransferase family 4 protein [Elusimicrobia bacterium]|nr:glycosyltransferase family 4 protein [Elusimicrobiota bacterium]